MISTKIDEILLWQLIELRKETPDIDRVRSLIENSLLLFERMKIASKACKDAGKCMSIADLDVSLECSALRRDLFGENVDDIEECIRFDRRAV